MTVYWVVWDAAAQWVVDRLESEGALPALSRLRAGGVTGAGRPPRPNCQTPPSLATLFSGTTQQEHGVTGFTVPGGPGDPVDAHRSGFGPQFPGRPPVWRLAQSRGLRAAFVHAPWVFDADGGSPRGWMRRSRRTAIRWPTPGCCRCPARAGSSGTPAGTRSR